MILRIELKYMIETVTAKGFYTADERKRGNFMYQIYLERGGNGEIEREFPKLEDLPYDKP